MARGNRLACVIWSSASRCEISRGGVGALPRARPRRRGGPLRGSRTRPGLAARDLRAADGPLHPRAHRDGRPARRLRARGAIRTRGSHVPTSSRSTSIPSRARAAAPRTRSRFLCRLWEGFSDFAFEGTRVDEAIAELEAAGDTDRRGRGGRAADRPADGELAARARRRPIVRSDVVEAPPRPRRRRARPRRLGGPVFIATRADQASSRMARRIRRAGRDARSPAFGRRDHRASPVQARRRGPRPPRLDPHRRRRWRRIATGAARPRPGAYRLARTSSASSPASPAPLKRSDPPTPSGAPAGPDTGDQPLRGGPPRRRARGAQRPPARPALPARGRRPARPTCPGASPRSARSPRSATAPGDDRPSARARARALVG